MADPSGIYFRERNPQITPPSTLTNAVVAAMLVTERGPLEPTLCRSSKEFVDLFGGATADNADSFLPAMQCWDNGCKLMVVQRVVHHTTSNDPLTATCATGELTLSTEALGAGSGSVLGSAVGPFNLDPGNGTNPTLVIIRNGGGPTTVTLNPTAAQRTSANGPFALTNGMTLTLEVNGVPVPPITFTTGQFVAIGAATAAEVNAVINGALIGGRAVPSGSASRIETDQRGTGASLNITGGTANAVLLFTTGSIAGGGNVANLASVTVGELETAIETADANLIVANEGGRVRITSNTTGSGSSVQVDASSTIDDEIGFDNATHFGTAAGAQPTLKVLGRSPGAYTGDIRILISAPLNGEAGRFNLVVERAGVMQRRYSDLSMTPTDRRYAPAIINAKLAAGGDPLIVVEDLDALAASPNDRPAYGTFGPLAGGDDGLTGLNDGDFYGGESANGKQGLRKLDTKNPDILICPQRATPAVHLAMQVYCDIVRGKSIFPIFELPPDYTGQDAIDYLKTITGLYESSDNGATYWPRILVTNPNKALYGSSETLVAPNSGTLAGLYCRVEGEKQGGVATQPAGVSLPVLPRNVRGLATDEVLDDVVRGAVFESNINPLHRKEDKRPGSDGQYGPVYVDGARTLSTVNAWRSVGQRRLITWLKKQIDAVLDPLRHKNITDDLLREMQQKVDKFMRQVVQDGALASTVPSEAYVLDFGPGLNTATSRAQGKTYGQLGVATATPNEFIFIDIGPDTRALDAELAADTQ